MTTAKPKIDQRVIALYDDFTHCHLDRRLFVERLVALVGASTAATLLPVLSMNYALAQQVMPDDPRLATETVSYAGSTGPMKGYLAYPKNDGRAPAIVVVHENRGLNPWIEDVARRIALEGYVALAPDLLASVGGTPPDEDKAMAMVEKLNMDTVVADAGSTMDYLKARADVNGKFGIVGFCWGGGTVNRVAEARPDLSASVAFYGVAPPLDKVADIKAALLLHYAGLDTRVDATKPGYEAALDKAHVRYTSYVYPDVNHAFFNDSNAARYNEAAAKIAWSRTVAFFNSTLRG